MHPFDYVRFRIRNPLAGIPHDKLLRQVDIFAHEQELTDIAPLLRKGKIDNV